MGDSMTITGADKAAARFRNMAKRSQRPATGLDRLQIVFADHIDRTFETKGASVGKRWKPLSRSYRLSKGNAETLVLTGGLRGSMHLLERTSDSIRFGTRHPLARLHQKGTPGKRVPARKFIVVTRELRRKTRDEMKVWIVKG